MKFIPGNCISIKIGNSFFAGIVTVSRQDLYEIVLARFREASPPTADSFINMELFCAIMKLGDDSTKYLDIFTVSSSHADQSGNIGLIHHLDIPSFSPAVGFYHVEDISEVSNYFDQAIGLRDGTIAPDANDAMAMFTERTFIGAEEFFKQQPVDNLFPTVKLYRQHMDATDFLQIYGNSEDPAYLVVHWGRIGEKSLYKQETGRAVEELREKYAGIIKAQKTAGYLLPECTQSLILQFRTGDQWGDTDDLDFRNQVWGELDAWLFWSGNGQVSGGDIGSGTVNLFLEVMAPEMALQTIKDMLERKKITRPFRLAVQGEGDQIRVIYPQGAEGDFFF